ncbi:MAG TPA: AcvB/VirJ family lysyl-phosphatidylglycerol hydrolase [Steroidobacteraceae bacterium]|nr:AcvB/VirJ family lysyl-phosphatidylglycerol hydrolase [Steroidobacteraceae bacterium]
MKALMMTALLFALAPMLAHADAKESVMRYGAPFGDITVYVPEGKPRAVVLFLSGDGGWHLGVVSMARHLAEQHAVVVGLDVRHYLADIAAHPDGCRYMAADFETLGHYVQRALGLGEYHVPLLYGYSSGATVAYATLVQSPPGTFGAAVSLGFCPDQKFGGTPLCPGPEKQLSYKPGKKNAWVFDPAPHLKDRWIAFQGEKDQVCPAAAVDDFAQQVGGARVVKLAGVGHGYGDEKKWLPQYQQLFDAIAPAEVAAGPADDVRDLPLVEVPAAAGAGDLPLAIVLSGDGGWAGLDKGVAAELAARGLPVVGLSTLKYYWNARTPEQSARDIERVMHHYMAAWKRTRVLLVGYSFGANVLPFIVNRLDPEARAHVAGIGLLGLEFNTSFEIRVSGWIPGTSSGDLPVRPEIERLQGLPAVCLYGEGESHDPCAQLAGPAMSAREIGKGHHFSGDYASLAEAVLAGTGIEVAAPRAAQ